LIFGISRLQGDRGTVTFAVLMICTSMLVCVATMLSVALIRMQIEANFGMHQVAYAAAKSVALSSVQKLIHGKRPESSVTPLGNVSVNTTVTGTDVVTVQVTGTYSKAIDTVRFTYDTIRKKVTDWEENIPAQ
jgi:hypothetical protein